MKNRFARHRWRLLACIAAVTVASAVACMTVAWGTEADSARLGGAIQESLNGDFAYISEAGLVADEGTDSKFAMTTGTAPWDDPTEAGTPGNDVTELDNTVRTFDMVSYTTFFRSKVYDDSPASAYRTGVLHFEYVIQGTSQQIRFEEDSMGWLHAKREVSYEISQLEIDGKPCQVLRGSYLWEPSEENPSAIGESYQELNVAVRVLSMPNGSVISPTFCYWLEGNTAGDAGHASQSDACATHGRVEPCSFEAPGVKVTAAPRFNVQLKTSDTRAKYIDTFDFSSGNEQALNKDAGMVNGRVDVLGVTLQVVGKTAQHGLRGCEIPNGEDITFDIDMASSYRSTDGVDHPAEGALAPLVWSLEGNTKSNSQADGREISGAYKFAAGGAPMNGSADNPGKTYESCYNGGSWTGVQAGGKVSITVSGYQLDMGQLPYGDGGVSDSVHTYYDPNTTVNYWEIQTACFSAGELWVVQPFYEADGKYIADEFGPGSFTLTAQDGNLKAKGVSGAELESAQDNSNQMARADDAPVLTLALEQPGSIDQNINYQQYGRVSYGTSLTDGCFENGKDWIVSGGQLNIQELIKHNSAEGRYTAVAYDDLVKFDDAFFDIEGVQAGSKAGLDRMRQKFLYGAKPSGGGWDHGDKDPGDAGYDDEMMRTTADDLVFFESLDKLRSQGLTCVAVLWEARGLASAQSTNCYFALRGSVAESARPGCVYMVTHSARAWNKGNVAEQAAEELGVDPQELSDSQYEQYAKSDAFPTRAGSEGLNYDGDYPEAFWVNDYATRDGLSTYLKSWYDANGYGGGSAGISYGDSCLVVAYSTSITKGVEQQTSAGGEKLAYDMDANQRTADYILKLKIHRSAGESITEGSSYTTKVYVEDTLPAGLSYVPGSAYWGGAYTQAGEGRQGKIEGGQSLEPTVSANGDGTTTLLWTLDGVKVGTDAVTSLDPIHYACAIGTPGDEKTDVINNQQLLNEARVWGAGEQKHDFSPENANLARLSIQVSKNNAVSLSKISENPVVEIGDAMGFRINVGNNSVNTIDMVAVDSLPFDGDQAGSKFRGTVQVREVRVDNAEALPGVRYYYTCDESLKGKTSIDLKTVDFESDTRWHGLDVGAGGLLEIPDAFEPVAIAAVGELPAATTLKMHLTLVAPNAQPSDRLVNRLTRDGLESDASSSVVSRSLEGIVWHDMDEDGIRADSEVAIDGVSAHLMVLKSGGDPACESDYEPYLVDGREAVVETGEQMDVLTGEAVAYEGGRYRFFNLPAGTFGVLFADGSFSMLGYSASPVDAGDDDSVDSDATVVAERAVDGSLEQAFIGGIDMPEASLMSTVHFDSPYHDLGVFEDAVAPDTGIGVGPAGLLALAFAAAAGVVAYVCWRVR